LRQAPTSSEALIRARCVEAKRLRQSRKAEDKAKGWKLLHPPIVGVMSESQYQAMLRGEFNPWPR